MTAISLSDLTKVNVTTYENYTMDCVYEQYKYDLDDCDIKMEWIDIEEGFDFWKFKTEVAEAFMDSILYNIPDFKERLMKYGIIYTWCSFYTPQYYNF